VISQVTIIFIKLLLGGQAMKNFFRFTFCLVILLIISSLAFAETNKIKIGFIVKMPEQTGSNWNGVLLKRPQRIWL
jgi:hypothetical protein